MLFRSDNTIGKDTALYQLYNTNIHEKIALGLSDDVEQSEDDVDEEDTVFIPEDQAKDYVKKLIDEKKNSHLTETIHITQDSTENDKSWLIY